MVNVVQMDFPDKQIGILPTGDWQGFRSNACAKEPETVEWIRSFKPASAFWDIGASVGPYSLIADALGHTVYAFEPNGPSYGELCQNIMLNNAKVKPLPIAVGIDLTISQMNFRTWQPGAGGHGGLDGHSLPVISMEADYIVVYISVPQYVKIDVDGGEMSVIESGRETWPHVEEMMVETTKERLPDIQMILAGAGLELKDKWHRSGEDWNYLFVRAQ